MQDSSELQKEVVTWGLSKIPWWGYVLAGLTAWYLLKEKKEE
jgi:hypothetical protein